MGRRGPTLAGLVVVAAAGAIGLRALAAAGDPTVTATAPAPPDPVADAPSPPAAAAVSDAWDATLPRPVLSGELRAAFLAAQHAKAACMRANGVADYPSFPDSFGDGRTAPPLIGAGPWASIDPTTPAYWAAEQACPLDTAAFDSAELRAASQEAAERVLAEHPQAPPPPELQAHIDRLPASSGPPAGAVELPAP